MLVPGWCNQYHPAITTGIAAGPCDFSVETITEHHYRCSHTPCIECRRPKWLMIPRPRRYGEFVTLIGGEIGIHLPRGRSTTCLENPRRTRPKHNRVPSPVQQLQGSPVATSESPQSVPASRLSAKLAAREL